MPSQFMIGLVLPALLSGLLTAAFVGTLSRHRWLAPLIALVPLIAVYLVNGNTRVYSIHGMYHSGIVYGIASNGAPPENPFFAGEPLQYPWVYHALVAWLARVGDLAPSWVFATLNLVAIAICFVFVAKLSRICNGDDALPALAVFLALFAALFPAVAHYLRSLDIGGYWYALGMPMGTKVLNVNAMPFGLVFFTGGMYSGLRVLGSTAVDYRYHLGLALGLLGCGYFYPLVWIGLWASCAGAIAFTLAFQRRFARNALVAAVVLLATTGVLVPFFDSLAGGRSEEASLKITKSPRFVLEHVAHLALLLLPFWVLIGALPGRLAGRLRRESALRLLVVMSVALMGTFALLDVNGAEYKLRILTVVCLGILAAPTLTRLLAASKLAGAAVVAAMLFPMARDACLKATMKAAVPDPYVEHGFGLEHADEQENAMYAWIVAETPPNAVFVDREATIPVFGRRALYVAGEIEPGFNGWRRTPEHFLHLVNGHPPDLIAARYRVVDAIYGDGEELSPSEVRAGFERFQGRRSVYVVARDAETEQTLAERTYLLRLAGSDGWSIFQLI